MMIYTRNHAPRTDDRRESLARSALGIRRDERRAGQARDLRALRRGSARLARRSTRIRCRTAAQVANHQDPNHQQTYTAACMSKTNEHQTTTTSREARS